MGTLVSRGGEPSFMIIIIMLTIGFDKKESFGENHALQRRLVQRKGYSKEDKEGDCVRS